MLAAIDQQRGARYRGVAQRKEHGCTHILRRGAAAQRRELVKCLELSFSEQVRRERQPRRHAHHAHQRRQADGQHRACGLQRGLGKGVAQEIRVLVPKFLIEQIDHHASAARCRFIASLHTCREQMRVQSLRQHDGCAGVAGQMLLHRRIAKALRPIVLKQRRAVDHSIEPPHLRDHLICQAPGSRFIGQISLKFLMKMAVWRRISCAKRYGFYSIFLRTSVMHGHAPARAGAGQRYLAA